MRLWFKGELGKRAGIALVVLGLLASVVAGREKPSIPAVEPAARIDTRLQASEDIDVEKLERPASDGTRSDPFASRGFVPAQAGAAQSAQAAKPGAPPLPFTYLGKAIEGGKLSVFLARGEDSYSVEAGQKIDGDYRVERVSETSVTFLYVPLKTRQTLDIPAVH